MRIDKVPVCASTSRLLDYHHNKMGSSVWKPTCVKRHLNRRCSRTYTSTVKKKERNTERTTATSRHKICSQTRPLWALVLQNLTLYTQTKTTAWRAEKSIAKLLKKKEQVNRSNVPNAPNMARRKYANQKMDCRTRGWRHQKPK